MLRCSSRVLCRPAFTAARQKSSHVPRDTSKDAEQPSIKPMYQLPDPMYDDDIVHRFKPTKRAPTRPGSVVRESNWEPNFFDLEALIKDPTSFNRMDDERFQGAAEDDGSAEDELTEEEEMSPLRHLPVPVGKLASLHRYPLIMRRVVKQTGKGKIDRMYALIVTGNGNGLVGVGEGKADALALALDKAFGQAVRNMDFVDRFEERTLWTDLDTKFGATRVLMRPRPVGFGLACAPGIHQVLKAAGIKDCSAKIWGSRNKINVIKAVVRILHAGHAPLAMGDGIGGPGRRLEAGAGMRGKTAIEMERGRVIVSGRTW